MGGPTSTLKGLKANGVNGVNGLNGINGLNGKGTAKLPLGNRAVYPNKSPGYRGPGVLARIFGIVARLLTWYSIFTILVRCPASLEACDETSPRICKPYFQLKHTVAPHVEPYYDAYAAPYIEAARPYYDALDQKIITPGWGYAKRVGEPSVRKVQALGKAQWEKNVQPQVEKYRDLIGAQYDERLAPHVHRVSTAFGPYYDIARTNILQTYHETLLPAYQFVEPHLLEGYRATSAFASRTVVPTVFWAWNKTYAFVDGTVGPQLRAIYMENVEPQLVKIGKRLGRYSSGKKSVPKPLMDASPSATTETTSSFAKPAVSVSVTSSSSATPSASAVQDEKKAATTDAARTRATMEPIPPPEVDEKLEEEDPTRRSAREIVAADLRDWQERYAKAADEGAAEIDERVQEIAKRMIRRNAKATGKSHLEQLQGSAVSELVSLRRAILEIIGAVNKGAATAEEGEKQIANAVRRTGMAVKDKAQAVRKWRETYEAEMQTAITKAAETHFAILENIRDLALQKIGMKWAWMDGVTYKDWAKYHLLKSRFDEWKGDLENHVVTHPSLEAAQASAADIEDEAMKVAASTAKELARLKQVAHWKLVAGDDSDEFDSTLMQQAAEAAEATKLAAASAAEAVGESVQQAKDAVVDAIGEGASLAAGAASGGASFASEAAVKATESVLRSREEQQRSEAASESSPNEPSEAAAALEDSETSPTDPAGAKDTTDPEVEYVAAASEEISSVVEPTSEANPDAEGEAPGPEPASSMMFETLNAVGNVTEAIKEQEDKAVPVHLPVKDSQDEENTESGSAGLPASETASVKPALFGAAAQSVPSRKPILDEDEDEDTLDVSEAMESMRKDLKSAYSAAMSRANEQYSQALSIVSAQIKGTPKPAHEQLLASVTSAYSKAMASASARLDDALGAASDQMYGKTTATRRILPTTIPTPQMPSVEWSQIESVAAERLQQGRAWAEEQYESAKIAIGLATPSPTTPSEHVSKLLDNARHNYYAGVGLAHARYSEFLAAASSALSSVTATPTPTDMAGAASSIASAASDSAESAVSAVSDGAASAVSAASAGASSAASVASQNVAAAGDKVAESWDAVVSRISTQVYGAPTPTPWYESIYSAASEYASSATSAAGEGAAAATSAAAAGSDELAKRYAAASSIVSELLVGKEPTFSESVMSRLSAAYVTGVSSASSAAGAAQATVVAAANQAGEAARSVGDRIASAASDATDVVKDAAAGSDGSKDEL
ncbi:uncharacterized protein B0T15DRAFT_315134 [Chaetomium strumarium]|uniref:Uncharacterized protein n=1 Tax=Chaetomium strumarium TaxID=1170767 RepID=A0AAJ0GN48_9PEZI|nr:hypothetical protein B0T15DRAFT_315134 [Chaetomium strumarium]